MTADRGWTSVEAQVGKAKFRFVNTHLESFDDGSIKKAQAEELLKKPLKGKGTHIVVGDFNSDPADSGPQGEAYAAMEKAGYERRVLAGFTFGHTADLNDPSDAAGFDTTIDHVFVNDPKIRLVKKGSALVGRHTPDDPRRPLAFRPPRRGQQAERPGQMRRNSRMRFRHVAVVAALAALAVPAGASAAKKDKGEEVTVMSRNIYLGLRPEPGDRRAGPRERGRRRRPDLQRGRQRTNFPERAVAARRRDQGARRRTSSASRRRRSGSSRSRRTAGGPPIGPGTVPASDVSYDFRELLMDELGLEVPDRVEQEEFTGELPADIDAQRLDRQPRSAPTSTSA